MYLFPIYFSRCEFTFTVSIFCITSKRVNTHMFQTFILHTWYKISFHWFHKMNKTLINIFGWFFLEMYLEWMLNAYKKFPTIRNCWCQFYTKVFLNTVLSSKFSYWVNDIKTTRNCVLRKKFQLQLAWKSIIVSQLIERIINCKIMEASSHMIIGTMGNHSSQFSLWLHTRASIM